MERTIEANEIQELTDAELDGVQGGIIPLVIGALMVGAALTGFTVGVGIGLEVYY